MAILHICQAFGLYGVGGAAAAATRRHIDMLKEGIDSRFLCVDVVGKPSDNEVKGGALNESVVIRRPCGLLRRLKIKFVRAFMRLVGADCSGCLNCVSIGLEAVLREVKPDHVYLHWIGKEMLRIEELAAIRCPVTIVLHDFRMLNAIAPIPLEDDRFKVGFEKDNSGWVERWVFGRKVKTLSGLDLDFEAPSEWVASMCRESIIGRGRKVVVRPSPVGPEFVPGEAKKDDGEVRVLFGCTGGRSNYVKGFDDLEKALALLPESVKSRMELRIFGESAEPCETSGVRTVFLGEIGDPKILAAVYRECDVLAFPSKSETQGLVKDEALACGLKVVAFNRAACAEGIVHGVNGFVAEDADGFAEGLRRAIGE